jgi:hypothetical protein
MPHGGVHHHAALALVQLPVAAQGSVVHIGLVVHTQANLLRRAYAFPHTHLVDAAVVRHNHVSGDAQVEGGIVQQRQRGDGLGPSFHTFSACPFTYTAT